MLEIKMPSISLRHLQLATMSQWVEQKKEAETMFSRYIAEYGGGFFVFNPTADYRCVEATPLYKTCQVEGWEELLPVLSWVFKTYGESRNVSWICFDADGEVIPDLKLFQQSLG